MSAADEPLSEVEVDVLFADLINAPALVLAVSGGPDSTALLALAARWREGLRQGPKLLAVTIDHGLRAAARYEAAMVKRLARRLGVEHRIVRWTAPKPVTGIQEKARAARYDLLAKQARRQGAGHIVTGHTLDDQAETVLLRLARGSGISGLAGMARVTRRADVMVVRPFLHVPKARLLATVRAASLPFADDPSNRDPRFTRPRLRRLLQEQLAQEGCDAERLSQLARRMRRADTAIEAVVDTMAAVVCGASSTRPAVVIDAALFRSLPAELALRLMQRAIAQVGNEGPVELGKLEAFMAAYATASDTVPFRRTLAGAMVTQSGGQVTVARAPARKSARTP